MADQEQAASGGDGGGGGDGGSGIKMPITKKTAVQPTLQGDYDIYGKKIAESGKTGILQKAKRNVWDPIATAAGAALDIPLGLLTSGARMIGDMLPYNERAVMENQMLESGFALDDIGRIVAAGDYNTPEGIMAGYNAAQMTADTFDKRMNKIRQSNWQNKVNQQARIDFSSVLGEK